MHVGATDTAVADGDEDLTFFWHRHRALFEDEAPVGGVSGSSHVDSHASISPDGSTASG